ncbi:MAG: hypothetical protein ACP5O1_00090 [Phycisphaerae bacterium]
MDIKYVPNPIDSAGPIKATLSNLFHGWGYNFYRKENQLRADDLLVRGKISELLGQIRAHLSDLAAAFRADHLPPPSREHPFPDSAAVHTVQVLDSFVKNIEQLEVKIRTAAVPEMDRINQRHRNEQATLESLAATDLELVGEILTLQQAISNLADAQAVASNGPQILKGSRIEAIWQQREEILSGLV